MAVGAAIGGLVLGVAGYGQSRKAAREAREARDINAAQIKATTTEEIRRKKYGFQRDISSIEAEIAAGGVKDVGTLRGAGRNTTTTVDADVNRVQSRVDELQKQYDDEKAAFESDSGTGASFTSSMSKDIYNINEELRSLKEQQKSELDSPWSAKTGIFGQYLSERANVFYSEIAWMRKTGLSNVKASNVEGNAAINAAKAQSTQYLSQVVRSGANWWSASQSSKTTTPTLDNKNYDYTPA